MPKSSILALCALCLLNTSVRSQVKVELYADADRTACALYDQGSAVQNIYVFQTGGAFSTGLTFSVPKPACWVGATWIQDVNLHSGAGNSQTQWTVQYAGCSSLPVLVGWARFLASGGAQSCCQVAAVPVEYYDCAFNTYPLAAGQSVLINPDQTCPCSGPIATEPSTWGRVKSLYR